MGEGAVRFAAALLLLVAAPALADSNQPASPYAYRQLEDPREEARAKALMEELRCLVCQGQSIADSDAELAGDMRSLVRERIKAGESPDQIRSWLVERYGSWVSYQPVLGPDTLLLYGAPILLLLAGLFMVARRLKRRPHPQAGGTR
jgi:cytochrome c-type biogenesis protein CcmH